MNNDELPHLSTPAFNRREFVGITVVGSMATGLLAADPRVDDLGSAVVECAFSVNGEKHSIKVDPRSTLLDVLRETLQLTGTKKGCDHGQCGACTVLANGQRVNSCLSLAVMNEGYAVLPLKDWRPEAIAPYAGGLCGTRWLAVRLLHAGPDLFRRRHARRSKTRRPELCHRRYRRFLSGSSLSDDEIRERMSGNLCRCGAYVGIVAAIRQVYEGKTA